MSRLMSASQYCATSINTDTSVPLLLWAGRDLSTMGGRRSTWMPLHENQEEETDASRIPERRFTALIPKSSRRDPRQSLAQDLNAIPTRSEGASHLQFPTNAVAKVPLNQAFVTRVTLGHSLPPREKSSPLPRTPEHT
jgi:hypothetical protein